ncbi:MAG: N-acetyltransferase [Candidatus Latescibacteria bacterium]|nr:N-acetyltransferase [Candidatus Latescibacterota bacterium]
MKQSHLPLNAVVRSARVDDVSFISNIVNKHAEKGIMLPRPISRIYDNVRDYVVVEIDGEIAGCGALHVMWSDLAEMRSLAIRDEYISKGLGRPIVEALLADAKNLGIEKVFVLTYNDEFFRHMGFTDIDKSELPHKIWTECINCIHFPDCDEVALIVKV